MASPPTNSTSSTNTWTQIARDQQSAQPKKPDTSSPTERISQERSLFISEVDGAMAAVVVSTPPSRKKIEQTKRGETIKVEQQQYEEGGEEWMPVTPKGRKTRLVSKIGSQPTTPEGRKSRVVGPQSNTPEGRKSRFVGKAGAEPTTPESKGKGRVIAQTQPEAGKSPPPSPWSPGRTYAQVLMGGSPARVDLEKAKERAQGMAVLFGGGRGVVADHVIGKGGEEGGEKGDGDVVMGELGREGVRSDSVETVIVVDKVETTIALDDQDGIEKRAEESSGDASGKQGQEQEQEQEQQPLNLPEASTTAYRISTTTEQKQPVLNLNVTASDAGEVDGDDKSVVSNQSSVFSDEDKDEKGETATQENGEGLVGIEVSEEEIKHQDIKGADETSTPRILTYVRLHNEMMVHQTTHSSNPTLLLQAATRAQNIARHLLTSHAKNVDVPLVMRAHSCLILGCSDSDDCYERMQEAVALIRQAGEEGALESGQAQHMLEVCGSVMRVITGEGGREGEEMLKEDGSGSEESEESEEDDDKDDADEGEEGGEDYRLP